MRDDPDFKIELSEAKEDPHIGLSEVPDSEGADGFAEDKVKEQEAQSKDDAEDAKAAEETEEVSDAADDAETSDNARTSDDTEKSGSAKTFKNAATSDEVAASEDAPTTDDDAVSAEEVAHDKATSEDDAELEHIAQEEGIRPIPESVLEQENKERKAPVSEIPEDAEDLEALRRAREESEKEAKERKAKISYTYRPEPSEVAANEAQDERLEPYLKTRRLIQLLLLFFIGVAVTLIALLPQFYLKSLYISGNELLTDQEIVELAGLEEGNHLLSYVNGDIFQILMGRNAKMEEMFRQEYSIIDDIRCQVSFPSGFSIEISEHQPMGVLAVPGGYAIVSGDAQVLGFRDELPTVDVPLITGLNLQHIARGERLPEEDSRILAHALRFLDTVVRCDFDAADGFHFFPLIKEIYVTPTLELDVSFQLPNSERIMLARFGASGSQSDEIYWLRHVLQTDALLDQGEGYIDLSTNTRVFVTPARPHATTVEPEPSNMVTPQEPDFTEEESPDTEVTNQFGEIIGQAEETTTTSTRAVPEETDEWGYPVEETEETFAEDDAA